MIERIVIENFKSFKKVDLKLGRLNLFIGTNASGKSNFFDALRVLQGIGNSPLPFYPTARCALPPSPPRFFGRTCRKF